MTTTLDEAIRIHLDNECKYLSPLINTTIQDHAKLHVRIFEPTPRDSKVIERRIAMKGNAMVRTNDSIKTQELSTEIEALHNNGVHNNDELIMSIDGNHFVLRGQMVRSAS